MWGLYVMCLNVDEQQWTCGRVDLAPLTWCLLSNSPPPPVSATYQILAYLGRCCEGFLHAARRSNAAQLHPGNWPFDGGDLRPVWPDSTEPFAAPHPDPARSRRSISVFLNRSFWTSLKLKGVQSNSFPQYTKNRPHSCLVRGLVRGLRSHSL